MSGSLWFTTPEDYENKNDKIENGVRLTPIACCWFTNLDIPKRHEKLILWKQYNEEEFPKYDNYDAINVDKTNEIPCDYDEVMGVPISFLDKYNPEQFEIVGIMTGAKGDGLTNGSDGRAKFYINEKGVYARILLQKKRSI